jgi:multidrug efflux pump subunit AcrA (membrane-fusion protein)
MKRWIGIGIIAVIIIVVVIRVGIAIKNKIEEPSQQTLKDVPVEVVSVRKGDIENYLLISGIAESTNQVEVISKVSGKIISLPVPLGSYVYQGSTIAIVDRDEPSLGFKNYVVDAPISGYVAMIMQDIGDYVNPSMPIAMIVKRGSTRIKCNVTEKDLPYIQEGARVRIRINGHTIPGEVTKVSGVIDTQTYSSQVEIQPESGVEKSELVPGTFVDIEIPLEIRKDVMVVPREAILVKNGGDKVYRLDGDRVELVSVKVGLRERDFVEIEEGLEIVDRVVVVGISEIEDGSKVRLVNEEPAK